MYEKIEFDPGKAIKITRLVRKEAEGHKGICEIYHGRFYGMYSLAFRPLPEIPDYAWGFYELDEVGHVIHYRSTIFHYNAARNEEGVLSMTLGCSRGVFIESTLVKQMIEWMIEPAKRAGCDRLKVSSKFGANPALLEHSSSKELFEEWAKNRECGVTEDVLAAFGDKWFEVQGREKDEDEDLTDTDDTFYAINLADIKIQTPAQDEGRGPGINRLTL